MRTLLRNGKRALRRLRHRWRAPRIDRVAHRWVGQAPDCTGRRVCIFVTYAPGGAIPDHATIHYRAWMAAGFDVILVACLDDLDAGLSRPVDPVFGLMVRENRGYDFGAWANAIMAAKGLRDATLCVTANDSVYGPLANFGAFVDDLTHRRADFIGVVENVEIEPHYQSFLLAFGPRALAARGFWRFWSGIREGGREAVIQNYELRLLRRMQAAGLTTEVMHRCAGDVADNPTLIAWRSLIDAGFPYVKIQLLRDNPRGVALAGWADTLAGQGYDPDIVRRHLKGRAPDELGRHIAPAA